MVKEHTSAELDLLRAELLEATKRKDFNMVNLLYQEIASSQNGLGQNLLFEQAAEALEQACLDTEQLNKPTDIPDSYPEQTYEEREPDYDRNYVDRVMKLNLPKKDLARALGEEFGNETEMQDALKDYEGQPDYRRKNITNLVHGVLSEEKTEIIDAEFESIDDVVEYKPSKLRVALKGTANLINKTRWYYPFVGMLPGKYQERIARRGERKQLIICYPILLLN